VDKAVNFHSKRDKDTRETDESFNAPIALDFNEWKNNPDDFDFPGVDTVPRDTRLERAKKVAEPLAEAGELNEIDVSAKGPSEAGVSGRAAGNKVEVKSATDDPESTLAHELGHQFDKIGGGRSALTQEVFGGTGGPPPNNRFDELRNQGAELASRRRSVPLKPEVIEDRAEDRNFAGGGYDEVFADAFAELVEEPRRARAIAPDLAEEMEEATDIDIF